MQHWGPGSQAGTQEKKKTDCGGGGDRVIYLFIYYIFINATKANNYTTKTNR